MAIKTINSVPIVDGSSQVERDFSSIGTIEFSKGTKGHSSSSDTTKIYASTGDLIVFSTIEDYATLYSTSLQLWAYPEGSTSGQQMSIRRISDVSWLVTVPFDNPTFGVYMPSSTATFDVKCMFRKYEPDNTFEKIYSQNLVGPVRGHIYPLPPMDDVLEITLSTVGLASGVASQVRFYLLDENKELIRYYALRVSDGPYRVIALMDDDRQRARYVYTNAADVRVCMEIGNVATGAEYIETDDTAAIDVPVKMSRYESIMEFTVSAGSNHSGALDRIPFNAKTGDKISVRITTSDNASHSGFQVQCGDGITMPAQLSDIPTGQNVIFKTNTETSQIGLSSPELSSSQDVDVVAYFAKEPLLLPDSTGDYSFISSRYNEVSNMSEKKSAFSSYVAGIGDSETFLFFTDPHIMDHPVNENSMQKAIGTIERAYNETPTSFVCCGGDWLTNSDTKTEAAEKLGRIDGFMRAKFGDRYLPVLGNHDTNYQGASYRADNTDFSDKIANEGLKNLWFREYGAAYYDFLAPGGTRFYVFDTQIDWSSAMDEYKWQQCAWFADALIDNDDTHSAVFLHILKNTSTGEVQPFASQLTLIARAYNYKTTVAVNGVSYDFSNTSGHVAFFMAGHTHADSSGVENDIPWIISTKSGYTPNFDLCVVDYANAKLMTYRVGVGSDREIDIVV